MEKTDSTTDPPIAPAPDLVRRALELLEFPQLLERLAGHTQTSMGRRLALSLAPAYSYDEALRRQQETTEAAQLLAQGRNLEMAPARDIQPLVERASLGGMLQGTELREVYETIRTARGLRATLAPQKTLPLLSDLARQIPDLRPLESRIAESIGKTGEVLDRASPRLGELRAQARAAHGHLTAFLERAVRRLQNQGVLQEPIITQRHGRMVLMVKAEMRRQVQGIVHDVSDSGATLFIEPLAAVSLGNQHRELQLAVEREEQKVLQAISDAVGARKDDLLLALDLLARIDLALAKARFSRAVSGVPVTLAQTDRPYLRLAEARHPLLPGRVVPNTVELGDRWTVMLITGPNAGGKTVSLKMTGLLAAMAQAGLHVPARQATMGLFDGFYADIGDQQSIQRSLSTFSSHVTNLRAILEQATPRSLVLVDELGTSTDPEEGAALAKALLKEFHRRGIPLVATSHHRDVAALVQETPGMVNASVELHPETLAPTYRLTIGLPGRSYALTIASRLGLPPQVIEDARSLLSTAYQQAESLLHDLQRERQQAEDQRREAQRQLQEAEGLRRDLEERLAGLELEKARLLEDFRRELQARAEELWQRLREVERELRRPLPAQAAPGLRAQRQEVGAVRKELRSPSWRQERQGRDWVQALKPGDWVYVRGISGPVEVLSAPGQGDTVEVAIGSIRARLSVEEVERKAEAVAPPSISVRTVPAASARAQRELDLRGTRVEEALLQVDRFLDQAAVSGLSSVRIIHGIGTGALRAALREYLAHHPLVRAASPEEGARSDGTTVVELV